MDDRDNKKRIDERIRRLVSLHFDEIPYSEEAVAARGAIERTLQKKLDASPDASMAGILRDYSSLDAMAELAGLSPEDVEAWRSDPLVIELKDAKRGLRLQRWRIYGVGVLAAALLAELFWLIYDAVTRSSDFFFVLVYSITLLAAALALLGAVRGSEREIAGRRYDAQAFEYMRTLNDRYSKRLLNSIALMFAAVALFAGIELVFSVAGNSKDAEDVGFFFTNLIMLQIPVFLLVKNTLCLRLLHQRLALPHEKRFWKHAAGMVLFSTAYWLLAVVLLLVLRERLLHPINLLAGAEVLFALLVFVYNLTLRKRVTWHNLVFNPRRVGVIASVVLLAAALGIMQRDTFYTQPYINSVPVVKHAANTISYDDVSGVYSIQMTREGADFKILHLTDIHLGGSLYSYSKDIKALEACYAEIAYTQPDLVVVTGDLCFPLGIMSLSFNNSAPVQQFAAFMRNVGVPWCFTYGNHDTETLASMNQDDLRSVYMSLSYKNSGTLLYPYVQPNVTGRNNQVIEVLNADGSLNTALFLIDSNAYTGEGINVYDYIHDDQVDWYAAQVERLNEREGHVVDSLVFFHIPLQQYRTAYELYQAGSSEVTYYFGENNETAIDKVCCSDYPSSLFDRMVELGSTTGTFCGHDHYNNMSLEYQGIRLTYGMSIDYLAMPGIEDDVEQRGAELITLHPDGSWDVTQIPLTSITE